MLNKKRNMQNMLRYNWSCKKISLWAYLSWGMFESTI